MILKNQLLSHYLFKLKIKSYLILTPFDEVSFPQNSAICFDKLFDACPDFTYNLEKDCNLAYKSFNTHFDFTGEEFYLKVEGRFKTH